MRVMHCPIPVAYAAPAIPISGKKPTQFRHKITVNNVI